LRKGKTPNRGTGVGGEKVWKRAVPVEESIEQLQRRPTASCEGKSTNYKGKASCLIKEQARRESEQKKKERQLEVTPKKKKKKKKKEGGGTARLYSWAFTSFGGTQGEGVGNWGGGPWTGWVP